MDRRSFIYFIVGYVFSVLSICVLLFLFEDLCLTGRYGSCVNWLDALKVTASDWPIQVLSSS